jgi:hypothetical protein
MLCSIAGPDHRRYNHDAVLDANDVPKVFVVTAFTIVPRGIGCLRIL